MPDTRKTYKFDIPTIATGITLEEATQELQMEIAAALDDDRYDIVCEECVECGEELPAGTNTHCNEEEDLPSPNPGATLPESKDAPE